MYLFTGYPILKGLSRCLRESQTDREGEGEKEREREREKEREGG